MRALFKNAFIQIGTPAARQTSKLFRARSLTLKLIRKKKLRKATSKLIDQVYENLMRF